MHNPIMDIKALLQQYSFQVGRCLTAVDDQLDAVEKHTFEFVDKFGFYYDMRAAFRAAKREQLYNDDGFDKDKIGAKVSEFATSTLANALRTKAASINLNMTKMEAVDVIRFVYRYKLAHTESSWPAQLTPRHWSQSITSVLEEVEGLKKSALDAKAFQREMTTTLARQHLFTVLQRAGATEALLAESMAIDFNPILNADSTEDDELVIESAPPSGAGPAPPANVAAIVRAPRFNSAWNPQRKRLRLHEDGGASADNASDDTLSQPQDDSQSDATEEELTITTNANIKGAIKLLHDLGVFKTYVRLSGDDQLAVNTVLPVVMDQPTVLHGINNAVLTPQGCATLEQMEELTADQFVHAHRLLQSCKHLSAGKLADLLEFAQGL